MIKKSLDSIEKYLARYRLLIGVLVLIMLIVLSVLAWMSFDKQNQIIETGGFVDGDVKCVCTQEAWDNFIEEDINISDITLKEYKDLK